MKPFTVFSGKAVAMPRRDVDTDQIIPARFLKVTTQQGLGQHAFADWRYLESGELDPRFELNLEPHRDAQVLVVGENFGCGSSREHAPWALLGYGIRALVSPRFADIFRNNALRNGLAVIEVDETFHQHLLNLCPATVHINLRENTLIAADGQRFVFEIEPFMRHCLLHGMDALEFLLAQQLHISRYEEAMT